jgi:hypothetical protein
MRCVTTITPYQPKPNGQHSVTDFADIVEQRHTNQRWRSSPFAEQQLHHIERVALIITRQPRKQ